VPSKITWVPAVSDVRSRVTPEGTATLLRTMVAQDFFDKLALAAPAAPENVQVARFSRLGAAVGAGVGNGAGIATARETLVARRAKKLDS